MTEPDQTPPDPAQVYRGQASPAHAYQPPNQGPAIPVQATPVQSPATENAPAPIYPVQAYTDQAHPAQAYPAQAYPAQAYPAQAYSAQPYSAQPYSAQPNETSWQPAAAEPAAPRRRISALMLSLILVVTALLCSAGGAGAYLLVQNAQPRGTAAPAAAVDGFLTAVFTDHSAQGATAYVCSEARDDAQLTRLVSQVRTFVEKFDTPVTTWDYPPVRPSGQQAEATVTLTLTTVNEQVATKKIRLLLVEDRGWWVCDAEAA